jgi:hypothetical protein
MGPVERQIEFGKTRRGEFDGVIMRQGLHRADNHTYGLGAG